MEPFPGIVKKKTVLTPEQEAWLRRNYPEYGNHELSSASGISVSNLCNLARKLGVRKSKSCMKRIHEEIADKVRVTCEQNGYYKSLREGKPSEAAIEAVRRRWVEIKAGRQKTPMQALKERDPERYNEIFVQLAQHRRELIRRERLRVKYGMDRLTRIIHICLTPYTTRQSSHRRNARKRGYILMADCSDEGGERWNIYFDETTVRSALFERNLQRDGFRVKPFADRNKREVLPLVYDDAI